MFFILLFFLFYHTAILIYTLIFVSLIKHTQPKNAIANYSSDAMNSQRRLKNTLAEILCSKLSFYFLRNVIFFLFFPQLVGICIYILHFQESCKIFWQIILTFFTLSLPQFQTSPPNLTYFIFIVISIFSSVNKIWHLMNGIVGLQFRSVT